MKNTNTEYPNHPINFIVPFGAGGAADFQARAIEKFASQQIGQPFVVINKPGAAGIIGWNEIRRAQPDGYTLGISTPAVLLHTLYTPNETHFLTSLDPIAQITSTPLVLVVNASKPWENVDDLIACAKQYPGKFKTGHSGLGSFNHVTGIMFAKATGTDIGHVPFQSGSETIAALLGNHIQLAFVSPSIAKEHIRVGTLRALANTGEKRLADPLFKGVPTLKESGINVVLSCWYGIVGPKEMPPEFKKHLEENLKAAIAEPEFHQNMAKMGMEIEYLGNDDSQIKWVAQALAMKKALDETGIIEEIRAKKQE